MSSLRCLRQSKLSTVAKMTIKTLIRNPQYIEGNVKFTILLQFSLNTKQNDYIRLFNKTDVEFSEVTYHGPKIS